MIWIIWKWQKLLHKFLLYRILLTKNNIKLHLLLKVRSNGVWRLSPTWRTSATALTRERTTSGFAVYSNHQRWNLVNCRCIRIDHFCKKFYDGIFDGILLTNISSGYSIELFGTDSGEFTLIIAFRIVRSKSYPLIKNVSVKVMHGRIIMNQGLKIQRVSLRELKIFIQRSRNIVETRS